MTLIEPRYFAKMQKRRNAKYRVSERYPEYLFITWTGPWRLRRDAGWWERPFKAMANRPGERVHPERSYVRINAGGLIVKHG